MYHQKRGGCKESRRVENDHGRLKAVEISRHIVSVRHIVERGSSVVECRNRNQVSPGSNPALLPCRRLGIFVLSIDAPVDSAV